MAASGGRTRPLRCFAIRVLSSASWRLRSGILLGYRFVAGYVLSHELGSLGSAESCFVID